MYRSNLMGNLLGPDYLKPQFRRPSGTMRQRQRKNSG
jgi:hypothetical protein